MEPGDFVPGSTPGALALEASRAATCSGRGLSWMMPLPDICADENVWERGLRFCRVDGASVPTIFSDRVQTEPQSRLWEVRLTVAGAL